MNIQELNYEYPANLVATCPQKNSRIMRVQGERSPIEITKAALLSEFAKGDVLIINDTKVLPRRVFSQSGLEFLFLNPVENHDSRWQVLFPAREVKDNDIIMLPGELKAKLVERGLPQIIELSQPISEDYFLKFGELALPPYIQKARNARHNLPEDKTWYQTAWAAVPGSQAAPTASLHFNLDDLEYLRTRGVIVAQVTLHVGMGTFLPIKVEDLSQHKMHFEWAAISAEAVRDITAAKKRGSRVWALGTTAVRTLESWACGILKSNDCGGFSGETNLFIRPGYKFEVVDCMLTNFHQPKSTLLALVSAFASTPQVLSAYEWAIQHNFRLFSYGDLTVWSRK